MKQLCIGFFLGDFLKDHFFNIGVNVVKNGLKKYYSVKKNKITKKDSRVVTKVDLVIKIKKLQYFKDLYTDQKNCEKVIFKYSFPDQIIEYINFNIENLETDIKTLCDLNYLHNYAYSELSHIGDLYLYITHHDLINVYTPEMVINHGDFLINDPLFKNIICCTLYYNSKIE